MKTRLVSRLILWSVIIFAGAFTLNGCKTEATDPPIQIFGSIRVMNFALSGAPDQLLVPMDIYIDAVGAVPDSLPKVNGLAYGIASVYTNNLPAATGSGTQYHLRATPIGQSTKTWIEKIVTLMPGQRYTWTILSADGGKTFNDLALTDGGTISATDANTKTYVRFLNLSMQPNNAPLELHVGNSANAALGSSVYPVPTGYVALDFKQDTSYTFYVTPAGSSSFISRIGFISFAPGSFHTIIYSGDTLRNVANGYKGDALDSLRIRIFDDNGGGADMTNPIPTSLRYNIVNAIVPSIPFQTAGPNRPVMDLFGFALNKDLNPKLGGYTFLPDVSMAVFPGHSTNVHDGQVDVPYAGGFLTPVVELQGFLTSATQAGPAFMDIHVAHLLLKPDAPFSIVLTDTVQFKPGGLQNPDSVKIADSTSFTHFVVALPDLPNPTKALITMANGISINKGIKVKTPYSITPAINDAVDPLYKARLPATFSNVPWQAEPGDVKLTGIYGPTPGTQLPEAHFKAVAGGIYEVVVVGQKGNPNPAYQPHFLVIHTNP